MDMKVHLKNVAMSLSLAAMLLTGCGGSAGEAQPTAATEFLQATTSAAAALSLDRSVSTQESDSPSGLPTDVETYYKTMVFIEGTAQLMGKFDLAAMSSDSTGFLPLIAIPGVMDDRVLATEQTSLPDGLAPAWKKALEARDGILQAFEMLLTTNSQDNYIKQMGDSLILASQAVAETEAIAASDYGATAESIALANRAALTEMGEAYQTFASMMLVIQSQGEENSE